MSAKRSISQKARQEDGQSTEVEQVAAPTAVIANALEGVEIVRPIQVPMGMRDDAAPEEIDDAPPSGHAQAEEAQAPPSDPGPEDVASSDPVSAEVAQPSSSDPVPAEVADAPPSGPAQVGEDLKASLDRQYKTVNKIDEAVAHFEIKRRRTPEYVELGRIATLLKAELGHGKWLPFLREQGYVERTIQRAMYLYSLFHDHTEDSVGLTLEQAEQTGKKAEQTGKKAEQTGKKAEQTGKKAEQTTGGGEPQGEEDGQQQTAHPPKATDGGEAKDDEDGQQEAPPAATEPQEAAPTAEVAGDSEAQGEDQDDNQAAQEKNEHLWGILAEATNPGFAITDAEREAFDTFMASIGDEDRAIRVLLHRIWNLA